MALTFLTSADLSIDIVVTCDKSVECSDEQRSTYLSSGDLNDLGEVKESVTRFTIRALSPSEREEAEVRAGAYSRSELGRILWVESPSDTQEKARRHPNTPNTPCLLYTSDAADE